MKCTFKSYAFTDISVISCMSAWFSDPMYSQLYVSLGIMFLRDATFIVKKQSFAGNGF